MPPSGATTRALREYRWFHEHALDYDPAYCGVRLSFVGQYRLAPTFTIAITREDDKLLAQATGQSAFALAQETPTTFAIKMMGAVIEFEIDATSNVTGLVLVQNGAR